MPTQQHVDRKPCAIGACSASLLALLMIVGGCYDLDRLRPPSTGAGDLSASFPDAFMDGGARDCGTSSFALCEDFEHGLGGKWTTLQVGATVSVDGTYAHSGSSALHVHLDSINSGHSADGVIQETETLTTPSAGFHVRAFLYFPSAPLGGTMTVIDAQQVATPNQSLEFQLTGNSISLWDGFASGARFRQTPYGLPIGNWACVEWIVQIGTPGSLAVSLQGMALAGAVIDDTTASNPPLGVMQLGAKYANTSSTATPAVDFWIDDVVVDPGPIGCN
jgi:hypothetical protein